MFFHAHPMVFPVFCPHSDVFLAVLFNSFEQPSLILSQFQKMRRNMTQNIHLGLAISPHAFKHGHQARRWEQVNVNILQDTMQRLQRDQSICSFQTSVGSPSVAQLSALRTMAPTPPWGPSAARFHETWPTVWTTSSAMDFGEARTTTAFQLTGVVETC